jgi:nucleoid DNA-binding protein
VKTSELIDHVATAAGVDARTAKKAVDAVFTGIVEAAKIGEEVSLPSFVKLKVKDGAARQGDSSWPRVSEPNDVRSIFARVGWLFLFCPRIARGNAPPPFRPTHQPSD